MAYFQHRRFILRDASLRDVPQDEVWDLMVRSRALRGVSNHEADGGLAFKRAKRPLFKSE
jgi:hypothetical protein